MPGRQSTTSRPGYIAAAPNCAGHAVLTCIGRSTEWFAGGSTSSKWTHVATPTAGETSTKKLLSRERRFSYRKTLATISSVACTRVWPDEYTVEATIDSERKVELAGRPPG